MARFDDPRRFRSSGNRFDRGFRQPAPVAPGAPKTLIAELGAFLHTPGVTDVRSTRILAADTTGFVFTGGVTDLERGRRIYADTTGFVFTGSAADLRRTVVPTINVAGLDAAIGSPPTNGEATADLNAFVSGGVAPYSFTASVGAVDGGVWVWDAPGSAGDTVVTFGVTGADGGTATANITVSVTTATVPATPAAPTLAATGATQLTLTLGPVPASVLTVTELTFQVALSSDTGFTAPVYVGSVVPGSLEVTIDDIVDGGTFIARQRAVSTAGASAFSAASSSATVTGTVELWADGTSTVLPFSPSGNGNPRTPALFSVSTSGTPTITPQAPVRDSTPILITTTATFHMPEERAIAVAAGEVFESLVVARQPASNASPTMRIKVRDGTAATETVITYTWATNTFSSNNTNILTDRVLTTEPGTDGYTRILISGTIATTTANLIVGRGPNSATGQGVLIAAVAHRVAPGAPPEPTIVPDEFIYVAKAANPALNIGTPNNANGRVATLAAAKVAPMATVASAVTKAKPGTLILVGDGIYQDGQVLFNASRSGTAAKKVRLVSETPLGATISGPLDKSAVEFSTAKHIEIHNFRVENRSSANSDNAALKVVNTVTNGVIPETDILITGCDCFGGGRDGIKVAASRNVRIYGTRVRNGGGSGSAAYSQSAIDFVTGLFSEVKYCTITGEWKEGICPKAGSNTVIEYNDVDITWKSGSNSACLVIGEAGFTRVADLFPFVGGPGNVPPAYNFKYAEGQDMVIRFNRLKTTFSHAAWFRGSTDCLFDSNWCDATEAAVEMKQTVSGYWIGQPLTAPAPHTAFAVQTGSDITYHSRNHVLTNNYKRTGLAGGIQYDAGQDNNIGPDPITFTDAASAAVLGVTYGTAGWDETAIYTALGI